MLSGVGSTTKDAKSVVAIVVKLGLKWSRNSPDINPHLMGGKGAIHGSFIGAKGLQGELFRDWNEKLFSGSFGKSM